nr:RNA-directed DNA polymerase, eukaryota [Tanacetum cinerariifolium]
MLLPKSDVPSRWVKQIPIKVNVLAWKFSMERLPTRVNLHRRGVQILLGLFVIGGAWFGTLLIRTDLGYLGLIWFSFNQVRNRCWKECFTLSGRVSGHIETISSSLIQILEKKTMETHDDEAESSRPKRSRQYKIIKEGCDVEIDEMLRINLCEAETNEEIFTFVAWIRAFNIKEPIYSELCLEFYSTYEFDEICSKDELQTKKIIKLRLGGHAHNLILLEFAQRLGLYHSDELDEEGFDVYFQGGLRSDKHFNAQEY